MMMMMFKLHGFGFKPG